MNRDAIVINRRRVLRASSALAGLAGLAAAPNLTRAQDAETTLELDVAQDAGSYRLTWPRGQEEAPLPTIGTTFLVVGSVYPGGTIDAGLTGPAQAGAIGRWVCQGVFLADVATAEMGATIVSSTVQFLLGDGLSATAGQLEAAADAIVTIGLEQQAGEQARAITGGYGRYAGARGEVIQTVRGANNTVLQASPEVAVPGANLSLVFRFATT